ncbi:MAG: hypothetical protein KIT44_12505, partial [Opitutaceae bacterium]|nr:hypothetical protein [Opitutaceae bacterium]
EVVMRPVMRPPDSRRETPDGSGRLWLLVLAGIGVLGTSVVFNEYGFLHFEWWNGYVTFHLGPGSVWRKIFNNEVLEAGLYLGREFSYLIDHIDMRVMAWTVRAGFPIFDSFVHLVLSLFIGIRLARYAGRDLGLGSLVGLLLALLFWTAPSTYLHFLMRTAKGLTAAGLVVVLLETHRLLVGNPQGQRLWRPLLLIAAAAAVMSFSDRQGVYFLLTIMAGTGIHWLLVRARAALAVLSTLGAVLVAELVAFFWITPALIRKYWGHDPDFSFNRMPWGELWSDVGRYVIDAGGLLFDTMGHVLGGLPALIAAPLCLALIIKMARNDVRSETWRRGLPASLATVLMLGALWAMYTLMILRHPPLLWPDIRVVYYWIPTSVLVVLGLAWSARAMQTRPLGRQLVPIGLGLLLLGNVASLPRHKNVLVNGVLRESIETSRGMRQLLMEPIPPDQAAPDGLDRINAFRTLRHLAHPRPADSIETDILRHAFRPDGIQRFLRVYGGNIDPRFLQTTGRLLPDAGEPALIGANGGQAELQVRFSTNRIRVEMYLRRLPGQERRVDSAEFAAYAVWNPTMQGRILRWQGRLELPLDREEITHEVEIDGSGLPTLFTLSMADASGGRVVAGWRNPTVTHVSREAVRPLWLMPSQQYQSVELTEQDLARLLPDAWRPSEAWMRGGRIGEDGVVLSPGGEVWLKCSDEIIQIDGESWREDGHEETGAGATGWWFKGGRLQLYEFPSTEGSRPGTRLFRAWGAEYGGWLVITAPLQTGSGPLVVRVTQVSGR